LFFEFDYDAYHVRILAKLINFPLDKESVHTQLGKMYFNKEELTEEEYNKSKELTFKQLYGGVFEQYKELPFFKAMNEYVAKLWELFNTTGKLELVGGKILDKNKIQNPTPNKILNYIIQSAETYNNIISVKQVIDYLENKQSKVILYTYDSFLVDYSMFDGKEVLTEIKKLLEINGYIVKVAYGANYNSLKKV
jgi:MFS superfamily sulfate permease-like transporter